jgi:hypothetical protein
MSPSTSLFLALLAVSSVSVAHTALRPFIPNRRPLNCGFCMSLWTAMGVASHLWTVDSLLAVPIAGFMAIIVTSQWPWAFYTVEAGSDAGAP